MFSLRTNEEGSRSFNGGLSQLIPVAATCKEIRSECFEVLIGRNKFRICYYPPSQRRSWLTRAEVPSVGIDHAKVVTDFLEHIRRTKKTEKLPSITVDLRLEKFQYKEISRATTQLLTLESRIRDVTTLSIWQDVEMEVEDVNLDVQIELNRVAEACDWALEYYEDEIKESGSDMLVDAYDAICHELRIVAGKVKRPSDWEAAKRKYGHERQFGCRDGLHTSLCAQVNGKM